MNKEPKIFVSSDLHFGHQKPFLYEPRGFSSIEEHDEAIIKNWNETVSPGDIVFLLGDVMLGDNEHGLECLKRLNGTIYIALGNHCTNNRTQLYKECPNVADIEMAYRYKKGKKTFILSHYPMAVGNDEDRNFVISLCGHRHTQDRWCDWETMKAYHVELDCHDNRPISIEEILEDIRAHNN